MRCLVLYAIVTYFLACLVDLLTARRMSDDEKDIEIPFPHMTLYMGKDKQGQAAPLNMVMKPAAEANL